MPCSKHLQVAESKLAMMEANEEQLRQRQERRVAEKEEENRLIQIMLNKFKVWNNCKPEPTKNDCTGARGRCPVY